MEIKRYFRVLQLILMLIVKQSPWKKFPTTSLKNWLICANGYKMDLLNYMILEYMKRTGWLFKNLYQCFTLVNWNGILTAQTLNYFIVFSYILQFPWIQTDTIPMPSLQRQKLLTKHTRTPPILLIWIENTMFFRRFWSDCSEVRSKGRRSEERCLTLVYTVLCTLNAWPARRQSSTKSSEAKP